MADLPSVKAISLRSDRCFRAVMTVCLERRKSSHILVVEHANGIFQYRLLLSFKVGKQGYLTRWHWRQQSRTPKLVHVFDIRHTSYALFTIVVVSIRQVLVHFALPFAIAYNCFVHGASVCNGFDCRGRVHVLVAKLDVLQVACAMPLP